MNSELPREGRTGNIEITRDYCNGWTNSCMTESNPTGRLGDLAALLDSHYKQYLGHKSAQYTCHVLKRRFKSVCKFKQSTFTRVLQSQDHS